MNGISAETKLKIESITKTFPPACRLEIRERDESELEEWVDTPQISPMSTEIGIHAQESWEQYLSLYPWLDCVL